jgi:hypothetical protein
MSRTKDFRIFGLAQEEVLDRGKYSGAQLYTSSKSFSQILHCLLSSQLRISVSFNQSVLSFLWSGRQGNHPLEDTRGNAAVFHLHASQPQITSKYSIEENVLT